MAALDTLLEPTAIPVGDRPAPGSARSLIWRIARRIRLRGHRPVAGGHRDLRHRPARPRGHGGTAARGEPRQPVLRAQTIARLGLDQPVWVQYLTYLVRIPNV
jgi:hypothetical protein